MVSRPPQRSAPSPTGTLSPVEQALHVVVERECAAFESVIGLLQREQDQLVAATPSGLEEIVSTKNVELANIERMRVERLAILDRMGAPSEAAKIAQFVGKRPEIHRAWLRLRALVREAQRLNQLNGSLVTLRLQFVNGRLDALRQAAGIDRLYDADGRAGGANTGRRVIAAV